MPPRFSRPIAATTSSSTEPPSQASVAPACREAPTPRGECVISRYEGARCPGWGACARARRTPCERRDQPSVACEAADHWSYLRVARRAETPPLLAGKEG